MIKQVTSNWLYEFIKYDPTQTISNTNIPVLAINGTLDCQVSAKQNLQAIETALKKGGNKQFQINYLSGLNHLFQTARTGDVSEYKEIKETFSEDAMQVILEWAKELMTK